MKTPKPRNREVSLWIILLLLTTVILSVIDIGPISTPYTEF